MSRILVGAAELLTIAIPGVIGSSALVGRTSLRLSGRLALSLVMGFALIATSSFVLAAASILSVPSLVASISVITVGLAIIAVRNGGLRAYWRSLITGFREHPWEAALGIAVLLVIALVRLRFSGLSTVTRVPSLRYWADATDIAASGSLPRQTLQWGDVYAPSAMKLMLNCFNAAMQLMFGSQPLVAVGGLIWVTAIGLATSLWWLAREVGLRWVAPLVPLWVAANTEFLGGHEIARDLNLYRAENTGRVVAFAALALCVNAIQSTPRSPRRLLGGGALFGVAALTHPVPTVICLCLFAFYSLYVVTADSFRRTEGTDNKNRMRRTARALRARPFLASLAWLVAVPGVALLLTGSAVLLAGGDTALTGAEGSNAYQLNDASLDPTLYFVTGRSATIAEGAARDWYEPPDELIGQYLSRAFNTEPARPWLWLAVTSAASLVVGVMAPARLRPAVCAALGLTVSIVTATLAFAYIYDLFVLANFGPRRLFDYASLPIALVGFVALESLLLRLEKARPGLLGPVSAALVVGVGVLLLPAVRPAPKLISDTKNAIEDYAWVRDNVTCDARIVSNVRSDATYQLLAGRVGVIEGMGPHLRPEMLHEINDLLQRNQEFFKDPGSNEQFLAEEGVDYVALVRTPKNRGVRAFPSNENEFPGVPFLDLAHSGARSDFYRVVGIDDTDTFPDPDDFPGYDCEQGPIRW
nr:hypothetical protein [Actinomycetota bacterium]